MAATMRLLCLVAAIAALAAAVDQSGSSTTGNLPDYWSLPQDTNDDIRLDLDRAPIVGSSYCKSYDMPFFGRFDLNITFIDNTKLDAVTNFMGQKVRCAAVKYRIDHGPDTLVFPKQTTDCVGLLVLSYIEPVSMKLGLDRQVRSGLRKWMTALNQCAGVTHP